MTPDLRELWPTVCRLATSVPWPPRSAADVDAFFAFANLQKLLPLLMSAEGLPPEVTAAKPRFRALEALYRKRYELSRDAVLELQRVLDADAFLFYKGADFRHRLYPQPELRPMADVDVYLPAAAFPAAVERLAAAGYPRKYSDYGAAFSSWHHEISVVIGNVHVELHRSFGQRIRASIDYDGIWQRRERFERDDISGYRLSPADAILSQAFELAKDEFGAELIRFVDFHLLVRRYQDELLLSVSRAKTWGIERPLFGSLHAMSNLFPNSRTDVEIEATERLLNETTRRFLVDRVLPNPASEPSGHVTGRLMQLWRKFSLMDRRWRRVALFGFYMYETLIGSIIEWRLRKSGLSIPPRPKVSSQ